MSTQPQPSHPTETDSPPPVPADDEERGHHEVAEYALLGLLRSGPAHGYRLSAAFEPEGRLGQILHLKMSLMYAYLRKLERQGWVQARTEATDSVRTRRVFTLTPEGEGAFDRWVEEPVGAMREVRLDFMVKLAFAIEQDHAQAATLVTRQEEAVRRWLERLRTQAAGLSDQQRVSVLGLVLGHRIRQSEATLTWLADVRGRL
jgi:PadR family transcriptional regulator, regulatory protein AphA